MSLKPLFDLVKIQDCVREKKPKTILFPAEKRSVQAVVNVFKERDQVLTNVQARDYILDKILQLKNGDFCEHGEFNKDPADVYGKVFDGENWYIKLDYDEANNLLREISFHPSKYEMTWQSGKKINKGKCQTWEK